MALDIKKEAEKIIELIQSKPTLVKEFLTNPTDYIKKIIKVDIDEEQITKIIAEVKKAVEKIDISKLDIDTKKLEEGAKVLGKLFNK